MADLKIPKLNKNSNKYIFKKKFNLKRKSRKRLFIESFAMFILSFLILYINYLIPNKYSLIQNLPNTISEFFSLMINLLSNIIEIFLVIFIFISLIISFILFIGSFFRLFKVINNMTNNKSYK